MSLSRQLLLIILGVFLLVFAGTFTISVNNTRHFLAQQLQTHAQDTATSLGLSLSPHMEQQDLAIIGRMVDAIYDGGYYQAIQVESIDGLMLVERSNTVQFEDIPGWFVNLVLLEPPVARAVIMSGWKQAGWVYVRSHPGYAYAELWRNTIQMFWLFLASTLTALLFGLVALRHILTPLRAVERQAEAVCRQEYPIQENLPRARELRRVVEAMNRMAAKVKQGFDEQARLVEGLRQQAFQDSVTGLGNRRYFNDQLDHLTSSAEEFQAGALLLVELYDFKGFNERHGYQVGDQLLSEAARLIREWAREHSTAVAARIGGADFAVLVGDVSADELDGLAAGLSRSLLDLASLGLADNDEVAHIGVAAYKRGDAANALLSRADMALRMSQSQGPNTWQRYSESDVAASERRAGEWKKFLNRAISEDEFRLFSQPVVAIDPAHSATLHREILLRVPDEKGDLLPAGAFMPFAERLGLAREMDRLAIGRLIRHVSRSASEPGSYALNVSSESLHDPQFRDWLCEQLAAVPAPVAGQLVFEFAECAVLRDVDSARKLVGQLRERGCRCNIDHFGKGFASFSYLGSLQVQAVKVDGGYIRNIETDRDRRFFVQELTRTLHGIDIQVIAENVETDQQRMTLLELGVDGVQGFLTGRPEPFC
jgi:diguanylate cyclase (GGDEF)-like protein